MNRDPVQLLRWAESRAREHREAADQTRERMRTGPMLGWRETCALREELAHSSSEAANFDRLATRYRAEVAAISINQETVQCAT